jgi:hypothetical protein
MTAMRRRSRIPTTPQRSETQVSLGSTEVRSRVPPDASLQPVSVPLPPTVCRAVARVPRPLGESPPALVPRIEDKWLEEPRAQALGKARVQRLGRLRVRGRAQGLSRA